MRKFFFDNWIIITIGIALMGSMSMAIYNNTIIRNNSILQKQSELVKKEAERILSSTIHGVDLGARGFGLTKEQGMLNPYNKALLEATVIFTTLDSLLTLQHYPDRAALQAVKHEVDNYISFTDTMIKMAEVDSMETFVALLKQDKGYDVWKKYDDFTKPLFAYEDHQNKLALSNYNAAIRNNLILQVSIILLALPALFIFVHRVRKERESRQALQKEVEENDRRYIFNSGETKSLTAKEINDNSINNSRKASHFVKSLSIGEYGVDWQGMNDKNATLNNDTLAGNLIALREQLVRVKTENQQRNSANEILAQFSEVVRNHQHDANVLADKCTSFLATKLAAQQAVLFILEGDGDERYLNLASCYAFDKKKFIEKRITPGNGLVGQAFLEGDVVQLKEIPCNYMSITSGLGEAAPRHLIIVPLRYDVHTVAVLEIASFQNFEPFQIDLLRKAGEFLASAILNSQTTSKMKHLLDNAMMNEEKIRSSEEKVRQQMEKLLARQEEVDRMENLR